MENYGSSRTVELNLASSRAPRAYFGKENLWKEDLKRIYRLISQHVQALKAGKDSSERSRDGEEYSDKRPHLAIAIFGPSGSGKSSLLRTLALDTRRQKEQVRPKDLDNLIYSLPPMDPTTWARSDQFLYAFLASALEQERTLQEGKQHGYPQGLSPVQLAFQEVNEYLRVIDDPETAEEYDPLGLSLQKLERHTSGLRLRGALGRFVDALADELRGPKESVVLLPVDDLDMAAGHLVRALEAYQSYLTHPRLVPVFTFTDMMPEELIGVEFRQRLGDEGDWHSGVRLPVSQQMAVQFLSRCFPVRNRIRMGPAPARVQRALVRPPSSDTSGEEAERREVLELLITASFLLFGHPDREDRHQVKAGLRPSTLRRQMQVVDAMSECRVSALTCPQFLLMGRFNNDPGKLKSFIFAEENNPLWKDKPWWSWIDQETGFHFIQAREIVFEEGEQRVKEHGTEKLVAVGEQFKDISSCLDHDTTQRFWAPLFSVAAWSLLNVHRDTLRELGLFLEDLYSWSPKELRSVVLDRILEQDRVTRRTVVDRWFNRTDYRRSQVLSLLAANIFRPWMPGEEPHGDEELAIRKALDRETRSDSGLGLGGPQAPDLATDLDRLSIRASKGFLWFLNVTLGFYLPQIMARNWSDALSPDEPVKGRISGNGWDLQHAPINAMRAADAKQELFSFGILFLDPRSYRHALATDHVSEEDLGEVKETIEGLRELDNSASSASLLEDPKVKKSVQKTLRGSKASWTGEAAKSPQEVTASANRRGRLLLRIWSCTGYSRGRFWAAFSLWRGLSFLGQVLELGEFWKSSDGSLEDRAKDRLRGDLARLIRSHCLSGLVPGSLLDRNSTEELLLQGSPRWEPLHPEVSDAIDSLVEDLLVWLETIHAERIFPLPGGALRVGWKDCFLRRVHGEYILGGLWPRLNAAYLEEQHDDIPKSADGKVSWDEYQRRLARSRYYKDSELSRATKFFPPGDARKTLGDDDQLRWTAAVAAGAWSDILLEYWRGCPPILRLLLYCPAFPKSRAKFGQRSKHYSCLPIGRVKEWRDRAGRKWREMKKTKRGRQQLKAAGFNDSEIARFEWLERLSLSAGDWKKLLTEGSSLRKVIARSLVPDELCIERALTHEFRVRESQHVDLAMEPTFVSPKAADGLDRFFIKSIDRRRHRESDEKDRDQ